MIIKEIKVNKTKYYQTKSSHMLKKKKTIMTKLFLFHEGPVGLILEI